MNTEEDDLRLVNHNLKERRTIHIIDHSKRFRADAPIESAQASSGVARTVGAATAGRLTRSDQILESRNHA